MLALGEQYPQYDDLDHAGEVRALEITLLHRWSDIFRCIPGRMG